MGEESGARRRLDKTNEVELEMPQQNTDKRVYLRQWVGHQVRIVTTGQLTYHGKLTNIAFEGQNRLMYIMLDDKCCLNYDQIIEISVAEPDEK